MTPASFCGITQLYPFITPEPSAFGVFAAGQPPDHLPVDPLQAACQEASQHSLPICIAPALRLCWTHYLGTYPVVGDMQCC